MDRKLHQKMRQMPTKQSTHTPNQSPTIQNQCSAFSPTVRNRSHGSNHSTPQQPRVQRHPHYRRPRLHQSSNIPTLYHEHNWRRNRKALPGQRVQMVQDPLQDHIRQRPQIHIAFLNLTVSTSGDRSKYIYSLSPTNGRSLRTKEPMGRTIFTICNQCLSRWLEWLAHNSHGSTQQLPKRHDTHRPNRSTLRVFPLNHDGTSLSSNHHLTHQRQNKKGNGKKEASQRSTKWSGMSSTTWLMSNRRQGLAQSETPGTPLSDAQTHPQMSWTLHDHPKSVTCRISITTPNGLDHT